MLERWQGGFCEIEGPLRFITVRGRQVPSRHRSVKKGENGVRQPRTRSSTSGSGQRLPMRSFCVLLLWWSIVRGASVAPTPPAPTLDREFRGLWVASKANIDWPSAPGLTSAQQQAELIRLLDTAVKLHLNAVVFQVRPQADALYESALEPWSEYLTGHEGLPPLPHWDPLAFAVREAHSRGLELHAWVNPFRARSPTAKSPLGRQHLAKLHPEWALQCGDQLWLDPGLSAVQEHSRRVLMDIVERYDIDALHMDDYFYPYPQHGRPFPDDASYDRYTRGGGRLERAAWRRQNVDQFVHDLGTAIHRQKPWVKFGISPFGIWRPGNPPQIKGLDAYEVLGADSRKWLQEGWVDYLTPQLYWPIDRPEQSFAALLPWWAQQNTRGRNLWPGLDLTRIGSDRKASEIGRQIRLTRRVKGVSGVVLWNATALQANREGVATLLKQQLFASPALIPASPWLVEPVPLQPKLRATLEPGGRRLVLQWDLNDRKTVRSMALQCRVGRQWTTELLAGTTKVRIFDRRQGSIVPDEVLLTPISRTSVAGRSAAWRRIGK